MNPASITTPSLISLKLFSEAAKENPHAEKLVLQQRGNHVAVDVPNSSFCGHLLQWVSSSKENHQTVAAFEMALQKKYPHITNLLQRVFPSNEVRVAIAQGLSASKIKEVIEKIDDLPEHDIDETTRANTLPNERISLNDAITTTFPSSTGTAPVKTATQHIEDRAKKNALPLLRANLAARILKEPSAEVIKWAEQWDPDWTKEITNCRQQTPNKFTPEYKKLKFDELLAKQHLREAWNTLPSLLTADTKTFKISWNESTFTPIKKDDPKNNSDETVKTRETLSFANTTATPRVLSTDNEGSIIDNKSKVTPIDLEY